MIMSLFELPITSTDGFSADSARWPANLIGILAKVAELIETLFGIS
jgi:hypothetical protein